MAFANRGKYRFGRSAAAVIVVGLLGHLVAVSVTAQVCLNKVPPFLRPADLGSRTPRYGRHRFAISAVPLRPQDQTAFTIPAMAA
jgi:hypothetical protein